jgi:hypothetical protein
VTEEFSIDGCKWDAKERRLFLLCQDYKYGYFPVSIYIVGETAKVKFTVTHQEDEINGAVIFHYKSHEGGTINVEDIKLYVPWKIPKH